MKLFFLYLRIFLQHIVSRNEFTLSNGINILEALNLYCLPEIIESITKVFSLRTKRALGFRRCGFCFQPAFNSLHDLIQLKT